MSSLPRKSPILALVTDRTACLGRPLEEVVAAAGSAGAAMVQVREKGLSAGELLDLGRRILAPVRAHGAVLVVNDRLDVALAMGADGVHLGGGSLPVREARRVAGDRLLVGASAHSVAEALHAEAEGADYVVLGTIFETRSHPGVAAAGPALVAEAARAVRIPIIAIGGINPRNAPEVIAAGARGVAVISALLGAPDVAGAARELLEAMREQGGGEHGR